MSYYIYGLHLKGDTECRYIGMTHKTPELRLGNLTGTAKEMLGHRCHPDGLWQWLLDNKGNIETFKVGKVEGVVEARAMEKAIIALALRLGQRLLNVQHVPDDQRIGYISPRMAYEARQRQQAVA